MAELRGEEEERIRKPGRKGGREGGAHFTAVLPITLDRDQTQSVLA